MPEAMGCTCMQRIPVRQIDRCGTVCLGCVGLGPELDCNRASLSLELSLNSIPKTSTWILSKRSVLLAIGPGFVRPAAQQAATASPGRACGRSLTSATSGRWALPPNPSSHLSQATRGLHGAVSHSEAVGRSFPPDGPIAQRPSSPRSQDLSARLGRWRFDLLTLPNQPSAQCFHGTFEDLFFLWVRGPSTPSTFLRRVRNRGRRVSLQGPPTRD